MDRIRVRPTASRPISSLDLGPDLNRDAFLKRPQSSVRLQRQSRNGWRRRARTPRQHASLCRSTRRDRPDDPPGRVPVSGEPSFAHDRFSRRKIIIRSTIEELSRHYRGNLDSAYRHSLKEGCHADVSISNHSHHPRLLIEHWNASTIVVPHKLRRCGQTVGHETRSDVRSHDVYNFHRGSLFC